MKKILLISITLLTSWIAQAQFWDINEPVKLKGTVNTEAEESMPVFSKDSSILYFTRTYDKQNKGDENDQDIWYSVKDKDGNYVDCKLLTDLNNKFNNTVFGINQAGNTIYVIDSYEGKKDLMKGCASSVKKGNSWAEPKHVEIPTLDIEGEYYGFHVNENESVIIISYKGPNSLGEEDLYYSKKDNGTWSNPIHMGNVINTPGFEISPFLTKGLDTLFFSSNGLGGEGDGDIFFAVRLDDSFTNWSAPKNLGNKINSPKFDAYFSITASTLYWSSNRDGEKSDIYTTTIIPRPKLFASAVGTDVTVYKGSDGKIDLTPKDGVGPYSYKWSNGDTVEDPINLVKGEYTVTVTDAINQTVDVTVFINEPPLIEGNEIGDLINLEPIYFDLGKWNIRPDAAKELDKIVAILNENPHLIIELGSHTDCRSSMAFNMRLSQNRAASSAAYIKARIKNPNRIYGKGYGETKLKTDCPCEGDVLPNCSEDQHQMNRRTEFVVVSNDSLKLPKKDVVTPKIVDYKLNPSLRGQVESKGSTFVPAAKTELSEEQKSNITQGFYVVQAGETLYRVHINTGISLAELKRINKLKDNNVKLGQKLLLK
ncbi:MAG: OmpA family protein [Flavobacteriia bacterium]|nr:OmpA family protein [Flavobacteriia bacterium]